MKHFAILCAACVVSICCSDSLLAQRRTPYSTSRPVLSPWVTSSGLRQGGVNNYLGMVRPRQQMIDFANQTRQFAATQQALERRAGYELNQLEQSLQQGYESQMLLQQRPTSAGGRAPARAAGFMNYSRFYPQAAGGGAPSGRYMSR